MATITSTQDGNWSDPNTWDSGTVPTSSDDVVIDHTVTYDVNTAEGSDTCNKVTVNSGGSLVFSTSVDTRLSVTTNVVVNGYLSIGDESTPIPSDKTAILEANHIYSQGTFKAYGSSSFVSVKADVLSCDSSAATITVPSDQISGWQVDDYIVTGAVYDSIDSITKITNMTDNGDGTHTLTVDKTTSFNYMLEKNIYSNYYSKSYILKRNVKIIGKTTGSSASEFTVNAADGAVVVDYTEFKNFYFNQYTGDTSSITITNSSFWHTNSSGNPYYTYYTTTFRSNGKSRTFINNVYAKNGTHYIYIDTNDDLTISDCLYASTVHFYWYNVSDTLTISNDIFCGYIYMDWYGGSDHFPKTVSFGNSITKNIKGSFFVNILDNIVSLGSIEMSPARIINLKAIFPKSYDVTLFRDAGGVNDIRVNNLEIISNYSSTKTIRIIEDMPYGKMYIGNLTKTGSGDVSIMATNYVSPSPFSTITVGTTESISPMRLKLIKNDGSTEKLYFYNTLLAEEDSSVTYNSKPTLKVHGGAPFGYMASLSNVAFNVKKGKQYTVKFPIKWDAGGNFTLWIFAPTKTVSTSFDGSTASDFTVKEISFIADSDGVAEAFITRNESDNNVHFWVGEVTVEEA